MRVSTKAQAWHRHLLAGGQAIDGELQRRGYRRPFGIVAVAQPEGEVFMPDLNARRTGSTHLHDFGLQFFGPEYLTSWTMSETSTSQGYPKG